MISGVDIWISLKNGLSKLLFECFLYAALVRKVVWDGITWGYF